ncbi:MAG TPA: Crp/Fnr family transcriptional regulator [Candidatus Eisenbacteria bacterium]|jgi:CRP-like cAMP-binding protein
MPPAAIPFHRAEKFEHFAVPSRQRISQFSRLRLCRAGLELFRQGDPAESVFLIERGLVKLIRAHSDGREDRIVGLRARGWVLGAAAAITNEPYVATAIAVAPSQISRLAAPEFLRLLETDRALSRRIHQMHAREVCGSLSQLGDESTSARTRLRRFLEDLASANGPVAHPREVRIEIPLRQWEIAQLLGVAPPYLSELMKEMQAKGVFRREEPGVLVLRR